MKGRRWCTIKGIVCENASPSGYCMMTACTKQIASGTITTNADHIRAMSDEELAEQLVINVDSLSKKRVYLAAPVGEIYVRRDIAEARALAWLQQPYKEGEA